MAGITLDNLTKVYDDGTRAVRSLDLDISDGELMVFVGPSGCGKTTALRMIAGLEEVTEGEIRIGDQIVNNLPAKKRDIAMVFQNYALYPHMSVYDNMAFGLKMRRLPKTEIRRRVTDAAKVLGLAGELKKKPGALSGGQRQRVAMGRAIVREPRVFLMDEPLSNLDAKLRIQMRAEIARIQRDLAVTTVYVTHDQSEAMTLGDRVSVMQGGRLQQSGIPQQVYDRPANLFVAGFIGAPPMNLLHATLERGERGPGRAHGRGDDRASPRDGVRKAGARGIRRSPARVRDPPGGSRGCGARPRRFTARAPVVPGRHPRGHGGGGLPPPSASRRARHVGAGRGGARREADERPPAFVARVDRDTRAREGEPIELVVDTTRLHFFDLETGVAI